MQRRRGIIQRLRRPTILALAATLLGCAVAASAAADTAPPVASVAVGPQYDLTHVYVAPDDVAPFVASFIATFGGRASKPAEVKVTPTESLTISRVVSSPVGFVSVFGFKTPISYPFGEERTGYLVTDMDAAVGRPSGRRRNRRVALPRRDRPRRHHPLARRGRYADLLAQCDAVLRAADDRA